MEMSWPPEPRNFVSWHPPLSKSLVETAKLGRGPD